MNVLPVDFSKSKSCEEQRQIRRIIRKINRDQLTKSELDVLMVLVNLWFYHRNGPHGFIRPGREAIAKKAGRISVVTVARSLSRLRGLGIIKPVAYAKGGQNATRYTMDLPRLREVFDPSGVETAEGKLVAFKPNGTVQNDTVQWIENDTVQPFQNDTRIYKGPEHGVPADSEAAGKAIPVQGKDERKSPSGKGKKASPEGVSQEEPF